MDLTLYCISPILLMRLVVTSFVPNESVFFRFFCLFIMVSVFALGIFKMSVVPSLSAYLRTKQ